MMAMDRAVLPSGSMQSMLKSSCPLKGEKDQISSLKFGTSSDFFRAPSVAFGNPYRVSCNIPCETNSGAPVENVVFTPVRRTFKLLGVSYITANLYCICVSVCFMFA